MTKKISIFLILLFFALTNAFSNNAYKNELLKVDLSQIGANDVKITLFTDKPYSEPLRLLRKSDSEFVLILPETYNSSPQKPSISDVIGDITDVDVRLYSFASNVNENGYTKIVIRTNGSTNLYPETVATGGGHVVNKEVSKIVASKITPTFIPPTNTVTPTKPEVKPVSNNIVPQKNKTPIKKVKNPINKVKETLTIKPVKIEIQNKQPKVEAIKKEEVKTIQKNKVEVKEPIVENQEKIITPEENIVIGSVEPDTVDKKEENHQNKKENKIDFDFFSFISGLLKAIFALILTAIAIKFSIGIVKSSKVEQPEPKKNENEDKKTQTNEEENSGEYSSFFKTIINSEIKGSNAFQLSTPTDYNEETTVQQMSQKEVLNIDQNLSWQEKFRALQNNKKALFKENDSDRYNTSENSEDMLNNPIKKLKQDFKAVKKAFEKTNGKAFVVNPIEHSYQKEQAEKVEIISFDDYQKDIEPPKVKISTTTPLKSRPPKVLAQLSLADEKGLYLIDYNDKIALIGYIKDKVFKLNSYTLLNKTKLYARLSESENGVDTYIVKFDDNKMLVDVTDDRMQIKLTY